MIIASIQMIDSIKSRFLPWRPMLPEINEALARESDARTSGAGQRPSASHQRLSSIDCNISPHSYQFQRMHKPIFKNRFGNNGTAIPLRHQCHVLSLHVGWECRIGVSCDVLSRKWDPSREYENCRMLFVCRRRFESIETKLLSGAEDCSWRQ